MLVRIHRRGEDSSQADSIMSRTEKNQFPSGQYESPLSIDVRETERDHPSRVRHLFPCGEPRGRAARLGGWLVVGRDRFAVRATLSSRTYIGRSGCPPREQRTASGRSGRLAASTGDSGRNRLIGLPREPPSRGFRRFQASWNGQSREDREESQSWIQERRRESRVARHRRSGINGRTSASSSAFRSLPSRPRRNTQT